MERFLYSRWDGSQDVPDLNADDILGNITDDLLNFGDLQHALRNMLQRGIRNQQGQRFQGLRDLLQQLRQQRRNLLEQYNLGSAFDKIKRELDEILAMERSALQARLDQAREAMDGRPEGSKGPKGDGEDQPSEEDQPLGDREGAPRESRGRSAPGDDGQKLAEMLQTIAGRKMNFLDNLPPETGGRINRLQEYEFIDPEAASKYQSLMEMLRKAMMETFFKDLQKQISSMEPEDLERMKEMLRDLNRMLSDKMAGGAPDFQDFMDRYGDMFGANPPESLEDLIAQMESQIAQMQSLLASLPREMRQQLEDLLRGKIADEGLQRELAELAINLDILRPGGDQQSQYPFRGDEEIDLAQAMRLMERLQGLDSAERQLEQAQYSGELGDIDLEKLEQLLGDDARQALDQLTEFLEILERAGYIRRKGQTWELTPRGVRRIGQQALSEIYAQLKKAAAGDHRIESRGAGHERSEDVKKYEFGDQFNLQLQQTLMNALLREGPQTPIRLEKDDFEVYATEQITQTATVMMLDLSWSMALRGSFQSAKRVALALHNLIRTMFPRDSLYVLGFSAYARELKADELPYARWDESVLGTNMHHALIQAQQLLARHKGGSRQIIMITDGEPTAHLEHGRSYFAYPPSPVTIRETLKEVKRCAQKGITINTFMLDRNYYLREFVNQMAKMNKGRVFYTTPDKLGQYILVDYVAQKRRRVGGA